LAESSTKYRLDIQISPLRHASPIQTGVFLPTLWLARCWPEGFYSRWFTDN
jgi:hypothetical protein